MKVSIIVKEVNSDYRQEIADRFHGGEETADNMKYNWEDEYEIVGEIQQFKIYNNVPYTLNGWRREIPFEYEIPAMTIVESTSESGEITRFAFSRKLIRETKKLDRPNTDIRFFVFIRDKKPHVSPQPGVYILQSDWPQELPMPPKDEDEEE
jgi:hypothetical protein